MEILERNRKIYYLSMQTAIFINLNGGLTKKMQKAHDKTRYIDFVELVIEFLRKNRKYKLKKDILKIFEISGNVTNAHIFNFKERLAILTALFITLDNRNKKQQFEELEQTTKLNNEKTLT
jgi:predicted ATP-dependent Lon-type protease